MKRKTIASVLALVLVCSMLMAACGKNDTPDTPNTPSNTTPSTGGDTGNPSTPAQTGEGLVDTGRPGYDWLANNIPKLSDELVTFTMAVNLETAQINYNDMVFFQELEKYTNVHIEFDCFDNTMYNQQKNLMLTTPSMLPDAFIGYNAISMADLNQYGPLGLFIPVEDLIDQYCPNYKRVLEETPVLKTLSTAFDEHVYSWGTVNDSPSRDWPDNLYINKTWLDNLGLDIPTTMDEYYNVLKAFKEQDANGNGDPNDEIPYTFLPYHQINGYGGFFGAYGEAEAFNGPAGGAYDHFVVGDDGKLIYLPITEEYKTAIKELSRFVQDGLWDVDGFTQDADQYNGKLSNTTGIVGSAYTWANTSFAAETKDQYIAITPLKATADSAPAKVHHRRNHISYQPTGMAITLNCKNPEILAKWTDLFYDDMMTILCYNGIDRVTEITEDGYVYYDESDGPDGTNFATYVKNLNPFDGIMKNLTTELRFEKMVMTTNTDPKIPVCQEIYMDAPQSLTLPQLNLTTEETQFFSDYGLEIQKYVMQKQSEWLLGRSDIDADWDAYIKQLQTLKLDNFISMMQGAYDR